MVVVKMVTCTRYYRFCVQQPSAVHTKYRSHKVPCHALLISRGCEKILPSARSASDLKLTSLCPFRRVSLQVKSVFNPSTDSIHRPSIKALALVVMSQSMRI
mmetsp:Transcript_42294/g.67726  ORF Transcript_42294/g.67726 Transcript_42294/m.67726 type:complete len:102 (-) Transcript_42294:430-735(-)